MCADERKRSSPAVLSGGNCHITVPRRTLTTHVAVRALNRLILPQKAFMSERVIKCEVLAHRRGRPRTIHWRYKKELDHTGRMSLAVGVEVLVAGNSNETNPESVSTREVESQQKHSHAAVLGGTFLFLVEQSNHKLYIRTSFRSSNCHGADTKSNDLGKTKIAKDIDPRMYLPIKFCLRRGAV
jgi:hypothetical protein